MSYTGNKIKIDLGELGPITDIAPDKVPPGALISAKNIVYSNGAVQKAPGTIRWNTTSISASIVAVHYWQPDAVTERFIAVTSGGAIYKGRDRSLGSPINSSIASVLTPNCMFAEGGSETNVRSKKLFLFTDGATNPYVLAGDSTAFATIATPNSDWTSAATYPRFGVVHRGSLWAFGGQFSYASSTSNHEDFSSTSAAFVDAIYPGEGGEIKGAFVYKGRLFAFKDGGFVYGLIDTDTSNANWYWAKIASNFGLAAPNAIDEVLDDMLAGNTSGTLNSYAASEKLGSVAAADIIQQAGFESLLRSQASDVGLNEQHTLYYPKKKQLFVTYRTCYRTTNDMLLMLDFARPGQLRSSFWVKGSPQCLALYKDTNDIERPMYGSSDGYIHLMDAEDRLEGETAYTGDFQTPHYDFSWAGQGLGSAEKHFDFLAVHYKPESSGDLSLDYFIDGRYYDTITFPMIQSDRAKLGVLLLGTDRLQQANTETAVRSLSGTGRTISFRGYNSGSNQSFQITGLTVFFRGGGEKATQV